MQEFISFFGHGFCHQLPERSFIVDGLVFSACARDTGIHLGFALAILAALIVYSTTKQKPGGLPRWPILVGLGLMLVPMAIDGGSSYLGLRPTTNAIRYITGIFAGCAAGTLVSPLILVLTKHSDPQAKIFSRPSQLLAQAAIVAVLAAAFYFIYPHIGIFAPFLAILAFLCFLSCLNLILITLNRRFAPKHTAGHWAILLLIALAMALIEITLLGLMREFIQHTILGGVDISEISRRLS